MGVKEEALARRTESDKVMYTKSFKSYHFCKNYDELVEIIKKENNPKISEYIFENLPVKYFYDIEIKEKDWPTEYANYKLILNEIIDKTTSFFKSKNLNVSFIVLKSHTTIHNVTDNGHKKSFHVIYLLTDKSGKNVSFSVNTCTSIANHLETLMSNKFVKMGIMDKSVFREGNLRAIYCSKVNEIRPIIRSKKLGIQEYSDAETFVQNVKEPSSNITEADLGIHINNSKVKEERNVKGKGKVNEKGKKEKRSIVDTTSSSTSILLPEEIKIVKGFVQYHYNMLAQDIKLNNENDNITVGTLEKKCPFEKRDHQSNHQYIVIAAAGSHQKCHSEKCVGKKFNRVESQYYSDDMLKIVDSHFNLKHKKETAEKLICDAQKESIEWVKRFDDGVEEMSFDPDTQRFTTPVTENCRVTDFRGGKCVNCRAQHCIDGSQYCMTCLECQSVIFPSEPMTVDSRFTKLVNFQTNYNQINGNVIINNTYNTFNSNEEDFSCDIDLNPACGTGKLTPLYNQILDGHKTAKISELLYKMDANYVYANGEFYNFTGVIWKLDKEQLKMKKSCMDLTKNFGGIKTYYETLPVCEINAAIIKNLKSLITKLNKPSLKNDIITEAKMYFLDETFYRLLNSKKHLVPFTNGVYDLVKRQFRKTKKDDYINLTMGFDYNPEIKNPEVTEFIQKILPDEKVRDYVLKKMSECLNGDIPNTHFLMFIGEGANGKSQILNLMKTTMGEFGEKVEVTLLTRKRNNANEANPEKIKLVNKRFGFLSEPEDGEKINIGLLKELTGSEEVVSRGLYEGSYTFVMETKLFLACNELPDIKGEDTAIWRRIRVVDFPSRFVDEPKASNEFLIDRSLPTRMREDITWRQSFVNILIDYHHKVILEPEAVKFRTNEYKEDTNNVRQWLIENMVVSENAALMLKEIAENITGKKNVHSSESSKIKKEVESYIKDRFDNQNYRMIDKTIDKRKFRGWKGYSILS